MLFSGNSAWRHSVGFEKFQGGNSFVYEVRREGDENSYALKLSKLTADDKSLTRFLSEIEIVQKLKDIPGCVKYIDHGIQDGKPFYVMPLYSGGTFRTKYINSATPIDSIDVIDDFSAVLLIVASIHNAGLAIRDIKPQNILINDNNCPIIADFGLSIWADITDDERHTRMSEAIGSQGYRPPEWQSRYPSSDQMSGDIWSLGRTLWAMFSRRNAPNNYETLGGGADHLRLYIPEEQSFALQGIITSCTGQDPSARPAIGELIDQCIEVKKILIEQSYPDNKAKTYEEIIKNFSRRVKNSDVYIDLGRRQSELNIRIAEMVEAANKIYTEFLGRANELNKNLPDGIGNFRALGPQLAHSVYMGSPLKFHPDDNGARNRRVTLRFDYSESVQQHTGAVYAHLTIYVGFSDSGKFYWIVSLEDYPGKQEDAIESFEVRSLSTVVGQKLLQFEKFIERFLEIIKGHF
ncbi:serine/threonine protein kinase [Delftia tsuruhatensis]|uniref:serine/threonine protein kinase n=1 Tax=Delftia tsuruhatensis TaxID=180282 RepID=UPI0009BB8417|nr:serine/threonine-protein kinase [Delftia tsuruhatensis]MDH2231207.1 serine/threonine protein kinase [Delftia tsuruhatensis]